MAGARMMCVAALLVLLAGCGEEPAREPAANATATRTATATPPASEDVTFRASDGETVSGSYTPAGQDGAPGLVGASIGASTAVLAVATKARRGVDGVVALSPPDSAEIWELQDGGRYRPHDVLFIADASEAASAEGMLKGAVRSRLQRSAGPGHGIALLPEKGVRDALLAWLDERVTGAR